MDLDSIERMTNSHNTNSSEASSNQILSQETGRRISLAHSSIESKTTSLFFCVVWFRRIGEMGKQIDAPDSFEKRWENGVGSG